MVEEAQHGKAVALRRHPLSRRALLGGGLGLLAVPLLQACAGAEPTATTKPAAPTAAPTKPAEATKPAAAATKPAEATKPAAAATKPAEATKPAAGAATKPAAAATKPAEATKPAAAATKPAAGATPAAAPTIAKVGGTVNVLAVWGGEEQATFLEMVKPFEEQSGATIQYEGTRDLNAVLETRIQGGNPPDVAGLPGPGQMAQYAKSGALQDLSTVLDMNRMRDWYSEDWIKLGQAEGKQMGIFIKAAMKGPIWYNPKAFQQGGYQVPKTWTELMELSNKIAGTGVTPWSIGLESAAASGWPGTDWIEDIVLRQAGPEAYDRWHQGQLKWSSSEIKKAWQTWGEIVGDPKMVFGGKQAMLTTPFGESVNALFGDKPNAYLHHQASFITTFIKEGNPDLKPVEDYNFFPFPDIESKNAGALEVAGDLFGMFKKTPQSEGLISYLTTPDAQAIWVKRGGSISPNKAVDLSAYPDQLSRQQAQTLVGARISRFDASDLMPEQMNNAFWKAILDFVNNPGDLDGILANLDQVQADAYKS